MAGAKAKKAAKKKPAAMEAAQGMPLGQLLSGLSKIIGSRRPISWGTDFAAANAASSAGDVRTDLGHPIDLRIPSGYRDQVKKVLEFFGNDALFSSLVRRLWEFGNTRFDWIVPVPKGDEKDKKKAGFDEQGFWNHWSSRINSDLNHILPGIDAVNPGVFKSLALSGMAPLHWTWGYIDYKGKRVWAPTKIKIENSMSIVLVPGKTYGGYLAFLKKQPGAIGQQARGKPGGGDKESTRQDLARMGTNVTDVPDTAAKLRKSNDFTELRQRNSFILRFEHTPLDSRVNRSSGNTYLAAGKSGGDGSAGYPEVPYICLQEAIQLRRGLAASDMRIIDGVINFMLWWSVGNNDTDKDGNLVNLPRIEVKAADGSVVTTGTMETVKEWLETGENASVAEWVLPYWVEPKILETDTATLLDSKKYLHATSEILHRFGVFMGEDASNPEIGKMNVLAFEAQIENMRQTYIARFWEMLARRVVDHPRNASIFTVGDPNFHWRPLQTRIAEWRDELTQLAKMGRMSWETVWRSMGVNPDAEAARIRRENESGLSEEGNDHTPVQFTQSVVGPDGEETVHKDGGTTSRGAPRKMPGGRKKGKT